MAGIEHHRRVARLDLAREFEDAVDHGLAVEVGAADDGEADFLQRVADGVGVVHRLGELLVGGQVGVVVIADDESDTALGVSGDR